MRTLVEDFIRHGRRYFQLAQLESLEIENAIAVSADPRAGNQSPPSLDRAVKYQSDRYGQRNELLRIGGKLAPQIEAAGGDSSELLLFLHAVDGGGGPHEAAKVWPALKVALQRKMIQGNSKTTDNPQEHSLLRQRAAFEKQYYEENPTANAEQMRNDYRYANPDDDVADAKAFNNARAKAKNEGWAYSDRTNAR